MFSFAFRSPCSSPDVVGAPRRPPRSIDPSPSHQHQEVGTGFVFRHNTNSLRGSSSTLGQEGRKNRYREEFYNSMARCGRRSEEGSSPLAGLARDATPPVITSSCRGVLCAGGGGEKEDKGDKRCTCSRRTIRTPLYL